MATPKFLIVDDNDDLCELFDVLFTSVGYETHVAHNAESALKILDSHIVDILLLDNDMPGITGREMLYKLTNMPNFERLKTIMVTANDSVIYDTAVQTYADLILLKPVSISQLLQLANRLLMTSYATTQ